MNLIKYELKKTFFNKAVIIFLVLLTALNAVTLYLNERINTGMSFDISAVKKIDEKLMHMNKSESKAFLKEYQIITEYLMQGIFADMRFFQSRHKGYNVQTILDKYDMGLYPCLTSKPYYDSVLIRSKIEQVNTVYSYSDYREEIDKKAVTMQSSSLFTDSVFGKKNAIKTSKDFSALPVFDLSYNASEGVVLATRNQITPILIFLSLVFIGFFIYLQDRDNETLSLLKTMRRGRKMLLFSKTVSAAALCIAAALLVTLSSFLTSYLMYGFGNISMPIQSVYGFSSCILNISVGGYLVLYILLFIIACLFAMSIVLFLFIVIQDSMLGVIFTVLFYGISVVLNNVIPYASWLNLLKFVNIYSFLQSGKVIGNYLNLNIVGLPVSFIPVFILICLIGFISFSYVGINIFDLQKEKKIIQLKFNTFNRKNKRAMTGVFKYEIYKSLFINPAIPLLLLFLLFQLSTLKPLAPERMLNTVDYIYMHYMKQLEGPVSTQKTEMLQTSYQDVREKHEQNPDAGYDRQIEVIVRLMAKDSFLNQMKESATDEKIKENISFVYEKAYNHFFTDGRTTAVTSIFASILIVLCVSNIFATEKKNNTYDLITSTVYGRKRTFMHKMLMCVMITVYVMAVVYIPYIYKFAKESGFNSLNAPVACIEGMQFMPLNVTIADYAIYLTVIKFTGLLLSSIVISFLSHFTGQRILTIGISFVVLTSPAFMVYSGAHVFTDLLFNVYMFGNKLIAQDTAVILQAVVLFLLSLVLMYMLFVRYNKNTKFKSSSTTAFLNAKF